jgi:hypothetical protein
MIAGELELAATMNMWPLNTWRASISRHCEAFESA